MIELTHGNLLEADADALVNTVNTQGVLGKGIALQFKRAFPEMEGPYKEACKTGALRPGTLHIFERPDFVGPKYIINFPTKREWKNPSRLADIQAGLDALVQAVQDRGIERIAIPPLGCGNGGLDWRDVYPMIAEAFAPLDSVRVLVYPPNGAPPPDQQVNRTKSPSMTPGRAALLGIMQRYAELDYTMTMLEVQKLAYFLQEAGQPLRLHFEKHHYGPYADDLRKVLRHLEGHFIFGFGDGNNSPDTSIRLLAEATSPVEELLSADPETRDRCERVARQIEGFETPYGLELLSTVHWVAKKETHPATNAAEALAMIHAWNPRKRELMQPDHVAVACERVCGGGAVESRA